MLTTAFYLTLLIAEAIHLKFKRSGNITGQVSYTVIIISNRVWFIFETIELFVLHIDVEHSLWNWDEQFSNHSQISQILPQYGRAKICTKFMVIILIFGSPDSKVSSISQFTIIISSTVLVRSQNVCAVLRSVSTYQTYLISRSCGIGLHEI